MAAQTSFSPDAVWIANSGASHHMDKVTNRVLFHIKSDHGLYPIPCSIPSLTRVDLDNKFIPRCRTGDWVILLMRLFNSCLRKHNSRSFQIPYLRCVLTA
ncbi:unnamed protein product [Prunus armeniaca]